MSSRVSIANCRVVLVRVRNPMNIGATARAMMNFGLTDLVLVGVHPPIWEEARSAIGAWDLLRDARSVMMLSEAVADCTLVVGTTAGVRHPRESKLITPAELSAELMSRALNGRIALLFGSEKTGLTNTELSHCHRIVRIPTERDCPSMNLGQAVAICCYEITRLGVGALTPLLAVPQLATAGSAEALLHEIASLLKSVGFLEPHGSARKLTRLRRTLIRFGLTDGEIAFFRAAVKRLSRSVAERHP